MTVIALGWKKASASGTPKVLYCGDDVDEAMEAIQKAGKEKLIAAGHVFRGIEDRVIRRIVFDAAPVPAI